MMTSAPTVRGGTAMAEYIEREMALKAIDEYFHTTNPDGEEQIGVLKSRKVIRALPAADVEVVKHGRWIEKEYGTYLPVECDENGDFILHHFVKYICDQCGRVENEKEPYCNCGAKMDLEG